MIQFSFDVYYDIVDLKRSFRDQDNIICWHQAAPCLLYKSTFETRISGTVIYRIPILVLTLRFRIDIGLDFKS